MSLIIKLYIHPMHNIYLLPITDMNCYKLISWINKLSTQNGRREGLGDKGNSKTIVVVTKE